MFSRTFKAATKATNAASATRIAHQVRRLATVEGSAGRIMPKGTPRIATPIAHDRATLQIKDGPLFNGKAFGAKRNISGEVVFTTSLV